MNTNAYGFLKKIVLFSYGEGIVIPLSIRYDECHPPTRRPRGGSGTLQKNHPEAGVIHREHYFHGSGVN